jgi:hypothetical protein
LSCLGALEFSTGVVEKPVEKLWKTKCIVKCSLALHNVRICYEMCGVVVVLARQLPSCQALSRNPEISKTSEISKSQKRQN